MALLRSASRVAIALAIAGCGDSSADGAGAGAGVGAGATEGTQAGSQAGKTHATGVTTGGVQPPPPACAPATGGGKTATSAPEMLLSLGASSNEGWLGSPAVADLDGDGNNEIVVARAGTIIAFGKDGATRWTAEVDGRAWSSPIVGDIRGDLPGLEVAQASGDSVYLFTASGDLVAGFPYTFRGELRSMAAGDVDGNGALDLVTVTTSDLDENGQTDILVAVGGDGNVLPGFPPNTTGASGCDDACYVHAGFDQNVALGDVDGDGVSDIFVTQDNAYLSLHKGTGFAFDAAPIFEDRTKLLGVRGLHAYAEAQQGYADDEDTALQAHHTNSAPALADLDADGVAELIFLASVQNASQSDREKGVALWVLENDGTRPAAWTTPLHFPTYLSGLEDYGGNIVGITNQVSVAEIDPTRPGPELVFAGFDGAIHAVDAAQGDLWTFQYTQSPTTGTTGVAIADLSGDGVPEIVLATYATSEGTSELIILDAGGNLQQRVGLPGRGAMSVPTIADVDGDGTLDITVALKDEGDPEVLVFRVPGSSPNCVLWGTGRRDNLRDGYVPPG